MSITEHRHFYQFRRLMKTIPGQTWLSKPCEVDPLLAKWKDQYPNLVRIDEEKQYSGDVVHAITVTDKSPGPKKNFFAGVPHAHEPAGTAAIMNLLNELLTGQGLDGNASSLPRKEILERLRLTFIPIGNPFGRKRAPVDWWDGTKYNNEEFEYVMVGKLMGNPPAAVVNTFWHYHCLFNQAVERLEEIGIVWEQIGDQVYAEPHLYKGCGFWKLVDRLSDEIHYDLFIELHQGMEGWEKMDTLVIHPRESWIPQESLAVADQVETNIIKRWQEAGASPHPGDKDYYQRAGFSRLPDMTNPTERMKMSGDWLTIKSGTPCLTIEVQNNNPRTPAEKQLLYQQAAIEACLEFLSN